MRELERGYSQLSDETSRFESGWPSRCGVFRTERASQPLVLGAILSSRSNWKSQTETGCQNRLSIVMG